MQGKWVLRQLEISNLVSPSNSDFRFVSIYELDKPKSFGSQRNVRYTDSLNICLKNFRVAWSMERFQENKLL